MKGKITKKRFILAGIVSGLMLAVLMALFDLYNQEPFSIWKFVSCFVIVGFFNGYVQYRAYGNYEKTHDNMNQ